MAKEDDNKDNAELEISLVDEGDAAKVLVYKGKFLNDSFHGVGNLKFV